MSGAYSCYYNLLYKDKDYAGEAEYIHRLVNAHHPHAKTLLDLGCGTGKPALLLAQAGYRVTGVDRSEEMLAAAPAPRRGFFKVRCAPFTSKKGSPRC